MSRSSLHDIIDIPYRNTTHLGAGARRRRRNAPAGKQVQARAHARQHFRRHRYTGRHQLHAYTYIYRHKTIYTINTIIYTSSLNRQYNTWTILLLPARAAARRARFRAGPGPRPTRGRPARARRAGQAAARRRRCAADAANTPGGRAGRKRARRHHTRAGAPYRTHIPGQAAVGPRRTGHTPGRHYDTGQNMMPSSKAAREEGKARCPLRLRAAGGAGRDRARARARSCGAARLIGAGGTGRCP